ncbi:hypothetical protein ACE01N_06135 [Saccharicrinis sp. FJH2]|uniref:hypothetical protein n=1 Tax=Saccharicrinis sp. FJH65 TaxID=3344659 RepID=UPI0035F3AF55
MKTSLPLLITILLFIKSISADAQNCDSVTTLSGIVPYVVEGNPTACTLGNNPGFKIDGYYEGTFYMQNDSVASFYSCSDENEFSFNNTWIKVKKTGYNEHQSFSFETSPGLSIEKVIVKGGSLNNLKSTEITDANSAANIYDYSGLSISSDTGLHAPMKADCKYYDISHIDFVLSQSVDVSHTATYSCVSEKTWAIDEEAVQDTILTFPGGSYSPEFITTAIQTGIVSKTCEITGEISVHNTLQMALTIDSLLPIAEGISIKSITYNRVVPCILKPDESIHCKYTASVSENVPEEIGFKVFGQAPVNPEQTQTTLIPSENSEILNDTVSVYRNGQFLGRISDSFSWTNSDNYTYHEQESSVFKSSTAIISETGDTDTDSVLIMVSIPDITVLTNTSFERTNHWSIEKTVSEDTLEMITGASEEVSYTVSVKKDSATLGYLVEGLITVVNPLKESNLTGQLTASIDRTDAEIVGVSNNNSFIVNPDQTKVFPFTLRLDKEPDNPILSVRLISGGITYGKESAITLPQNMMMVSEVNDIINVTDSYANMAWYNVSEDCEWTYNRTISEKLQGDAQVSEGTLTFDVDNTATIAETGQSDDATVNVTYYFPVVEQTTVTSFNRDSEWDLTVTSDPEVNQFPSDQTDVTYTIKADKNYTDSKFQVTGTVSVTNPSEKEPMIMIVSDIFNGSEVEFNEIAPGDTVVLQPGETIDLTYTYTTDQKPIDQQNTVIIEINDQQTSDVLNQTLNEEDAIISETNGSVAISDTFGTVTEEPINESTIMTVTRSFDTPVLSESDYIDGKQSSSVTDIFTMDEYNISSEVTTTVNYYIPTMSKTVATDKILSYDWTISKSASVDELNLMAGEESAIDYTISVDKTGSMTYYAIKGTVYITNTNPDDYLFVTVMEQVNGSQVMLEGANMYGYATIPPASTSEFTYTLTSAEKPADGMAITFMANAYTDQVKSVTYSFNSINNITAIENDTVTVTDSYGNMVWNDVDTSAVFTYSRPVYTYDLIQSDFMNGIYNYTLPNTAKIIEVNKSASASVKINCYAPVVSQNTIGTFERSCNWSVNKTSDSTNYTVTQGETVDIPFEVKVDATVSDDNYSMDGTIHVYNPHPTEVMSVELSDLFNYEQIPLEQSVIQIDPVSTKSISFSLLLNEAQNGYNSVIAQLNGISFTSLQNVTYNAPADVKNGTVTIFDSMLESPLGDVTYSDQLPVYFNYVISKGPDFSGETESIQNIVTISGDNDTIITTSTCEVLITVEPDNGTDPEPDPDPEPTGAGCTLTPGYWKTHSSESGKYDIKWTNLPDLDQDGNNEYEKEIFYTSDMTYLEVISSPTVSSCYIILGRAFGAAYLNILAGSDPSAVTDEISQAMELLSGYSIETAEEAREIFLSVASTLDKYNNGIIGPGHCDDTDRNSTTTIETNLDQSVNLCTYPNPSEGEVYFNINLTESAHVRLEVYDSLGNLLDVLFDAYIDTDDIRNIEIPFFKEPSRIYFYRLIVNGEIYNGSLLPQ